MGVTVDSIFVYRWDGTYFGFILDGYLYDPDAEYLGWIDTDDTAPERIQAVWEEQGPFLFE